MKPVDPSQPASSSRAWTLIGLVSQPAIPQAGDWVVRWLAEALLPLVHSEQVLRMIQDSAQKAIGRALQLQPELIDLSVYAQPNPNLDRPAWGFFRIENKEKGPSGKSLVHVIRFFLYPAS